MKNLSSQQIKGGKIKIFLTIIFSLISLLVYAKTPEENILDVFRYTLNKEHSIPNNLTTKKIKVSGHYVYYICNKELRSDADNLLLIHGFRSSSYHWVNMMTILVGMGYNVYALDLPGYGQSRGYPIEDYQAVNQVDLLDEFCQKMKLESFHIAGNSMGGSIAVLYSDKYKKRVKTLAVLGSPACYAPWSPQIADFFNKGYNIFIPLTKQDFIAEMELVYCHKVDIPARYLDIIISLNKKNREINNKISVVTLIKSLYDCSVLGMPSIKIPMLVVWGKNDKVFEAKYADTIVSKNPGCLDKNLIFMENASHGLIAEYPEKTADIYIKFLKDNSVQQ